MKHYAVILVCIAYFVPTLCAALMVLLYVWVVK